ncbi:MAG: zinc-ribbon domain-containing protein [bacterium]
MIVECTNCHSKYNVDENKIPPGGVKVRCPKCQSIISVKKEVSVPTTVEPPPVPKVEPPPPPKVEEPAIPKAKESVAQKIPVPKPPEPEVPLPPEPQIPAPSEPEVPVTPPAQKPVTPEPEQVMKVVSPPPVEMSEEDKKWHERARRLAKALASDLVLYNQEKVEQGLREGTLIQLLGSEIRRSWEYYCQQIPKHIIENSDYFKEQLNKIVGKGKEIFK